VRSSPSRDFTFAKKKSLKITTDLHCLIPPRWVIEWSLIIQESSLPDEKLYTLRQQLEFLWLRSAKPKTEMWHGWLWTQDLALTLWWIQCSYRSFCFALWFKVSPFRRILSLSFAIQIFQCFHLLLQTCERRHSSTQASPGKSSESSVIDHDITWSRCVGACSLKRRCTWKGTSNIKRCWIKTMKYQAKLLGSIHCSHRPAAPNPAREESASEPFEWSLGEETLLQHRHSKCLLITAATGFLFLFLSRYMELWGVRLQTFCT